MQIPGNATTPVHVGESDMSPADGPGADPQGLGSAGTGDLVHFQLVEALILLLVEKGVLTKNDALSIVQTVAQVQRDEAVEDGEAGRRAEAAIRMLHRMYISFEALPERSGDIPAGGEAGGENVHQLRPPTYGDNLEFPRDD
jgi:hypothetical protein